MLKMAEMQQPIVLVTLYDTVKADDAEDSTAALHSRMIEIVQTNQWLMARAIHSVINIVLYNFSVHSTAVMYKFSE